MLRPSCTFVAALLAALSVSSAIPARADDTSSACLPIVVAVCPSIAGGEFEPNGAGPSGGVVLSASVPRIPAAYIPQISLAIPFRGPGRYAVTGELRTPGNLYGGVGVGIGNLDGLGESGFTVDVLGGLRILPNVSLVGRYYLGGKSGGGNSGFFGVQLGF